MLAKHFAACANGRLLLPRSGYKQNCSDPTDCSLACTDLHSNCFLLRTSPQRFLAEARNGLRTLQLAGVEWQGGLLSLAQPKRAENLGPASVCKKDFPKSAEEEHKKKT